MVKTYEERIKEANDKRLKKLAKLKEKYARDKANKNGIWASQKAYKEKWKEETNRTNREKSAKKKEQKENIEKSRIIKNNIDDRIRMAKKRRLPKSKGWNECRKRCEPNDKRKRGRKPIPKQENT